MNRRIRKYLVDNSSLIHKVAPSKRNNRSDTDESSDFDEINTPTTAKKNPKNKYKKYKLNFQQGVGSDVMAFSSNESE